VEDDGASGRGDCDAVMDIPFLFNKIKVR